MDKQSGNLDSTHTDISYNDGNYVDLVQLLDIFKRTWKLCLLVVFIFTVFAFFLSLVVDKTYQVESILLPPEKSNINHFIIPLTKDLFANEGMTREELYLHFLSNLKSKKLRKQFLAEDSYALKLADSYKKKNRGRGSLYSNLDTGLTVDYKKKIGEGVYSPTKVQYSANHPEHLAELLNKFITFVDRETVKSVVSSTKSRVVVELQSIQSKISSLRDVAEENRKNIIYRIKECIEIAKRLNILDPVVFPLSVNNQKNDDELWTVENGNQLPDYRKGVRALEAELSAITNRKDNDPFIPGLLKLMQKEKYLSQLLDLTFNDIHAITVDKQAAPTSKPVKPNKILFVLVGFFFGILISIFIILIKNIVNRMQ